jgi:D-serine deaminase-like pyridoxal phosphate-dependent protein
VRLTDLRTPSVVVDKPTFERNLDRMQAAAAARNIRLRPHAKTHKSPELGRMQMARGAVGVCCAKLGEAEVFADAGIGDIRLPYPLNPVNAGRVLALVDKTRLSFIVDDLDVARGWSQQMQAAGRDVDVLSRSTSAFTAAGSIPRSAARRSWSRAWPSSRASRSADC